MPSIQITSVSLLAGIGFTMPIFDAQLGFAHDEGLLLMAKTGILAASLQAGVAGFIWLYLESKSLDSEGWTMQAHNYFFGLSVAHILPIQYH